MKKAGKHHNDLQMIQFMIGIVIVLLVLVLLQGVTTGQVRMIVSEGEGGSGGVKDVALFSIMIEPQSPIEYQYTTISVTIKNVGGRRVVFHDGDTLIIYITNSTGGDPLTAYQIRPLTDIAPALSPGESRTVIDRQMYSLPPGSYYAFARVSAVEDQNSNNNEMYLPFTYANVPEDLALVDFDAYPSEGTLNTTFYFKGTVQNTGDAPTILYEYQILYYEDPENIEGGWWAILFPVELAPGETYQIIGNQTGIHFDNPGRKTVMMTIFANPDDNFANNNLTDTVLVTE